MTTHLDARQDEGQVHLAVELSSDDPLDQLRGLHAVIRQLDHWQRDAIARARDHGATWAEIGGALGVSKQAAWQLYNEDIREILDRAHERSRRDGLTEEDALRIADEEREAIRRERQQ